MIKALSQDLHEECILLLNEEWPQSSSIRLGQLCRKNSNSLVLINNGKVEGHVRIISKCSPECTLGCFNKCGWKSIESRNLFFTLVVIQSKQRGKGFGTKLVKEALKGKRKVWLKCNQELEAFYAKFGFILQGTWMKYEEFIVETKAKD